MTSSSLVWAIVSIALTCYLIYMKYKLRPKRIRRKEGVYQVVVIINTDLPMSKGKVLSQFGHAIDGMHETLSQQPEVHEAWRNSGSAKIALKGTQAQINDAYYSAKALGIPYYRVYDAGKTQIPAGSNTCITLGPATKAELEPISGGLKLY
ncbi:peptidyl-tRNA hydrolase, PTH2 family [Pancytospora philotis]|nr:peptidyl-tRNA hydrolase, PTH2 family [Pancytospora philotis]